MKKENEPKLRQAVLSAVATAGYYETPTAVMHYCQGFCRSYGFRPRLPEVRAVLEHYMQLGVIKQGKPKTPYYIA